MVVGEVLDDRRRPVIDERQRSDRDDRSEMKSVPPPPTHALEERARRHRGEHRRREVDENVVDPPRRRLLVVVAELEVVRPERDEDRLECRVEREHANDEHDQLQILLTQVCLTCECTYREGPGSQNLLNCIIYG